MAIPHLIFKQLAKKRLHGKEGKEKHREIRKLLDEMPGYLTGPYGEIRKWLMSEIQETRKRRNIQSKNFFDVKKEGDAQIIILGPPNIGKSSLLKKLSSIQIKVADYAFTTLKPIPTIVDFGGALVQIVEIPGLIEGANEGRGGGRAMLSAARNANYIVIMTSVDCPLESTEAVYREIIKSNLPHPKLVICNKIDLAESEEKLSKLRILFSGLPIIEVSTETGHGIEGLKRSLWKNLNLIRVFLKNPLSGKSEGRPIVVSTGSSVRDIVQGLPDRVRHSFRAAKIWGKSALFEGQVVGERHTLQDGDEVVLF